MAQTVIKHVPTAIELQLAVHHATGAATSAANQLRYWHDALKPELTETPYETMLAEDIRLMNTALHHLQHVSQDLRSCSNDDVTD